MEKKDEILETSRKVMEEQEKEIEDYRKDLEDTEAENRILRQSMELANEEMELSRSDYDCFKWYFCFRCGKRQIVMCKILKWLQYLINGIFQNLCEYIIQL